MTDEQTTYYWDRMLRAVARGETMNQAQRDELAVTIEMHGPDTMLASAAAKLVSGTLTTEDVKSRFKAMNTDAYRVSLATVKDQNTKIDDRLAALING